MFIWLTVSGYSPGSGRGRGLRHTGHTTLSVKSGEKLPEQESGQDGSKPQTSYLETGKSKNLSLPRPCPPPNTGELFHSKWCGRRKSVSPRTLH